MPQRDRSYLPNLLKVHILEDSVFQLYLRSKPVKRGHFLVKMIFKNSKFLPLKIAYKNFRPFILPLVKKILQAILRFFSMIKTSNS